MHYENRNSEISVKIHAASLSVSVTLYAFLTHAYKAVLSMTRNLFSICKVSFRCSSTNMIKKTFCSYSRLHEHTNALYIS
jgi:hypothetical protein